MEYDPNLKIPHIVYMTSSTKFHDSVTFPFLCCKILLGIFFSFFLVVPFLLTFKLVYTDFLLLMNRICGQNIHGCSLLMFMKLDCFLDSSFQH